MMKGPQLFTCLSLTLTVLLYAAESQATLPVGKDKTKNTQDNPKYKYDEASTLSGIDLKADRKTKKFTLKFDQHLSETGILEIKNAADQVLFTRVLAANNHPLTRTYEIGQLKPGLYSIEVKTSDTTFWKKVRINR